MYHYGDIHEDNMNRSTVSTWQSQLAHHTLNAGAEHHRSHGPHPREVPSQLLEQVKKRVEQDATASGETTTDVVHEFFEEQGRQVSAGFLRHFRQDIGNKLTTHVTLTAGEWRERMVEVGGRVWYELISEETTAKSHLSAGVSNSLSGNQNELVKAQLPSGRRVFPSYGGEATLSRPAQAGFGVSVTGQGCEVVGDQANHHSAAVVSTPVTSET